MAVEIRTTRKTRTSGSPYTGTPARDFSFSYEVTMEIFFKLLKEQIDAFRRHTGKTVQFCSFNNASVFP